MSGWFTKELVGVESFKALRYRMPGLCGRREFRKADQIREQDSYFAIPVSDECFAAAEAADHLLGQDAEQKSLNSRGSTNVQLSHGEAGAVRSR